MIPDDFSLQGRVAVVTGGSRGIGSGIVELLAERGAVVGFTFHEHEAPARALEQSSAAHRGRIWCAKCDVADDMAVETFFSRVVAELGPVDILVNNAGIARDAHVMMLDSARWDAVLEVNLRAAFTCVRAVVRGMLLRKW